MTDEQLLAAVQQGDMQSLGQLVQRWERPLFRFVSRMVPAPDDAHDVCQETFLRVLDRSDRFRSGSRFSTWMYQIALKRAVAEGWTDFVSTPAPASEDRSTSITCDVLRISSIDTPASIETASAMSCPVRSPGLRY